MDAMKLLKGLMGNKSLSSALGSQLLGSLLGGSGEQSRQSSQASPLTSILSGMLGGGGGGQSQGGNDLMSGLLGSVLGGGGGGGSAAPAGQEPTGSAASGLAGMASGMVGRGVPTPAPAAVNDQAILMIRAMVNAAKSDGRIDQQEQENIIGKLGDDISESEIDFLKREFAAPLDVASFARSIPNGLEQQIYAMSLTSIELDTQNEANYLGQLAQGLNLDPQLCNQIHDHLGAPKIFG